MVWFEFGAANDGGIDMRDAAARKRGSVSGTLILDLLRLTHRNLLPLVREQAPALFVCGSWVGRRKEKWILGPPGCKPNALYSL